MSPKINPNSSVPLNLVYQGHGFHLVNPSLWPLTGSVSAFMCALGTAMWMHEYVGGGYLLFLGVLSLVLTMIVWWGDVIDESLQGHHTSMVQNGIRMGVVLFIVSEVMFFLAFFWGFFHSALAPTIEIGCGWPPVGIEAFHPFQVPLLNTAILLLSGASITWSHHALVGNALEEATAGLVMTIVLALVFTFVQAYEYIEAPFSISDGAYGTTFYMTTGLHGFHVFIGTVFLIVCLFRHLMGHFTPSHHVGYEAAIWYWHFVDAVWIFLYVFVYVWGNDADGMLIQELTEFNFSKILG